MVSCLLAIIYLAFISLGLPDSLLGAAWPTIYPDIVVPMSRSGILFMIIAFGTVVSSLCSDRLTRKLGAGGVTACSVATTAIALLGFACSHSFLSLCLWAIPYGIGAGSVDAALNNYVALHYASRHMSWLHCMWGVGTVIGPYIMSHAMVGGTWHDGYRQISWLQFGLTALLIVSLPLWRKVKARQTTPEQQTEAPSGKPLSFREILRLPGAKAVTICFFLYSGIEQTMSLWASSYLVTVKHIDTITAARFASLFFIGITMGRGISGFVTMKVSDSGMIRIGEGIIGAAILLMLLPFGKNLTLFAIILIGVGCAPIYPSIIHSTPAHFGTSRSQAVIGVQMACAYIGTLSLPPLFGWISARIGLQILPIYLVVQLIAMIVLHEVLCRKTQHVSEAGT